MFLRKSRAKSESALKNNNTDRSNGNKNDRRRTSCPASSCVLSSNNNKQLNGIMKFVSADESIHSVYGENKKKTKLLSGDTDSETNPASEEDGNNNCCNQNNKIRFKDIQIREYARTVGDNPSCSSGPPIAISWEYDPATKILSIDEYENCREPRRTHFEMVLPRSVRDHMLRQEWGIGRQEIAAAVRANIRTKNQRRATVNNLSSKGSQAMEELLEKTGRKLMRGLLLKKSTSQQVAELEEQYQRAERLRKQAFLEEHMKQEYEEECENNGHDKDDVQDSDLDSDDPNDMQDMTTPTRRIVAEESEDFPATTTTTNNSLADSPKTVISSDEDTLGNDDIDRSKQHDTTSESDTKQFLAI